MGRRCDRNRKRSKRRAIYCPIHGCYLDSVSQKFSIYSNRNFHLKQHGMGKQATRRILENHSEVVLRNHWLEAFWCEECQDIKWYYIYKNDRDYKVSIPPNDLWERVVGVNDPRGNPSVGEFTLRYSRVPGHLIKQFGYNT